MSGSAVQVALRVAGTPERAFEVFTRDVALWWRPNGLFRFTPRSPGVIGFQGEAGGRFVETLADGKVFEIGRIRDWTPGRRLVFGWRCAGFGPDMVTEVEVLFEPVGDETRVTVIHRGWDMVPAEHAARHDFPIGVFLKREADWWQAMLAGYGARVC